MAKRPSRRTPPSPAASPSAGAPSRQRWWASPVVVLLAAVFLAKLVVLLQLESHPLLQPKGELDSAYYLDLARRVAGGDWRAGDRVFFLSPFYIYFLALPLALSGGSLFVALVFQIAAGTSTVWLVGDTARLFAGQRARWVAMVLVALCGYLTFNEIQVLQSSVDPALTALGLWLLARAWTAEGGRATRLHLLAGIVLGCHTLNRPNVIAWAAVAALCSLLIPLASRRRPLSPATAAPGRWRGALSASALVLGIFLALSPAAIRNYAVAGQVAAVASHGGLNFFIGNNAEADGTYKTVRGVTPNMSGQDRDVRKVASEALGRQASDTEASSWFYGRALEWIRSNPVDAAKLFGRKLAYALNAADVPLNQSYVYYRTDGSWALALLAAGPWLLLPFGLAGIWFGRERVRAAGVASGAWWAWVTSIPVHLLSVVVFFVTGRYRIPLLVALSVPSALLVDAAWERWRAARWRALLPLAVVLLPLVVCANWSLRIDEGLAGWRAEMVQYYVETGRYEDADSLLARTEDIYPNPGLLLYRVANVYLTKGEPTRAIALLERATAKAPDRLEVRLLLGEALVTASRPAEAVPHLRAALQGGYRRDVAAWGLARALAAAGNRADALATLRQLPDPEALDPRSQTRLGRLALDLGDAALAEAFLARAVERAPGMAPAQEGLGLARGAQGRRLEAVSALEAAVRLDPGNPTIRLNLAVAYAQAGRPDEARRLAEDLVAARPDYARARQFLEALGRASLR